MDMLLYSSMITHTFSIHPVFAKKAKPGILGIKAVGFLGEDPRDPAPGVANYCYACKTAVRQGWKATSFWGRLGSFTLLDLWSICG
jgi:hypothetical protein